ncbi:MAG: hypothetical protein WDM89_11145 [Rhizomicrobium sp.]
MLRFGYFEDFKGGPKFLFWGDGSAVCQLGDLLRSGSVGNGPLGLDPFSKAVDGKTVMIRSVSRSTGLRPAGSYFEWSLSKEDMVEFAELVDVLADRKGSGHQYLTCGTADEITVMVSKDEYPAELGPQLA